MIEALLFLPLIVYAGLIIYLLLTSGKSETTVASSFELPPVSILIAIRNEEKNIESLVRQLLSQHYPTELLHICIVDDHSTDRSASIVKSFDDDRITLLQLPPELNTKKKAIEYGINHIESEIVITTDGDCFVGKLWVSSMIKSLLTSQSNKMITGPVHIDDKQKFFGRIQYLEMCGMMLVTRLGISSEMFFLANGANSAFFKSAYLEHKKNLHFERSSGDDIFLMNSIASKNPNSVKFCYSENAIVTTERARSITEFLHQRVRWASKTDDLPFGYMQLFQAVLWLVSLGFILSVALFPWISTLKLIFYIAIPVLIDSAILLIYRHYKFRFKDLFMIPVTAATHLIYIFIVGIASVLNMEYLWKDRRSR